MIAWKEELLQEYVFFWA